MSTYICIGTILLLFSVATALSVSVIGETVALLVARRINNRKVVGSRPTEVVCITVLTGNRMGWNVRWPPLLPSCRKLESRLSALMDSDLAWVNSKSARQSWCYADTFQRCIISGPIYHFIAFAWVRYMHARNVRRVWHTANGSWGSEWLRCQRRRTLRKIGVGFPTFRGVSHVQPLR